MGHLFIFLSVTFKIGAIESLNCGRHAASSCGECGDHQNVCNGDCVWSFSSGLCTPYPIINPGKLPEFVTVKIVVGYDHHFLKNMNKDDNASKSAIRKIITDANKRLGHPNLKPGVKLEASEIYSVNGNVTLRDNGGVKSMPESLKRESVIKRAPFVLITGIGRM